MNEIFAKRKSIRKFQEVEVEEEKLNKILEAARLSPSWKNMQCGRLVVVKDVEVKNKLDSAIPENNPIKSGFLQAPLIIVCCALSEESEICNDIPYYLVDMGILIENICLCVADLGLGTCIVGWFDEAKAKEVLNIPEDKIRVIAILPIGYPAKEPRPVPRKEIKDIVYYEKWG